MDELEMDLDMESIGIERPEPEIEMEQFYNEHYIVTDARGRITDGWSDGPFPDRDATDDICIEEQGGYQFRLAPDGEENPALYTEDGVPLYRWDGEVAVLRTAEEIQADLAAMRPDPLEAAKEARLAELSAACNAAVVAGCDVTLTDGAAGHISLTPEDQINLTAALAGVESGAEAYPYHLDGELCASYPAADIQAMAQAATAHKLYHTTYYNHLAAWVRRCESMEQVRAVTYGAELPGDLAEHMARVLATAGGGSDAV